MKINKWPALALALTVWAVSVIAWQLKAKHDTPVETSIGERVTFSVPNYVNKFWLCFRHAIYSWNVIGNNMDWYWKKIITVIWDNNVTYDLKPKYVWKEQPNLTRIYSDIDEREEYLHWSSVLPCSLNIWLKVGVLASYVWDPVIKSWVVTWYDQNLDSKNWIVTVQLDDWSIVNRTINYVFHDTKNG